MNNRDDFQYYPQKLSIKVSLIFSYSAAEMDLKEYLAFILDNFLSLKNFQKKQPNCLITKLRLMYKFSISQFSAPLPH